MTSNKPKRNAREDILNTAERLFAESGIENVSLRTINAEAGYSAAALHYHFASREKLLEALLVDRQRPVMSLRTELIEKLDAGTPLTVKSLAAALVLPFARLIQNDQDRGLLTLKFFFRAYVARRDIPSVRENTRESLEIFDPLLAQVLPELAPETRRIRWLMATELTFQGLANMESILEASAVKQPKGQHEQYVQMLIDFIAGGLLQRD